MNRGTTAEDVERPLCKCHNLPMLKNGVERRWAVPRQAWGCPVERREKAKRTYDTLEHVAYSKRLLQMRRATAIYKLRKERSGPVSREGRD